MNKKILGTLVILILLIGAFIIFFKKSNPQEEKVNQINSSELSDLTDDHLNESLQNLDQVDFTNLP